MLNWFKSKFRSPQAKVALAPRHNARPVQPPRPTSPPPAVHQATVDEVLGLGKNPRFDAAIDDVEYEDLQVLCRRGDEEIPLANPSRAFYFGDRPLYSQEAQRFDASLKAQVLNTDTFPDNSKVFDELKRACDRGFVIPFVGAGMSRAAGLPDWREYLLGKCAAAGIDQAAMRSRLDGGEYEQVMTEIVEKLTTSVFERDFERDFVTPEEIKGPVMLLPALFDCTVVTTNFDRVLERVYEDEGRAFSEKCSGRGRTDAFFRAIPAGDRHLLKLHGNIDTPGERILSRAEYEAAYGNPDPSANDQGNINMNSPLPRILDRLFSSYSLLFLGCSLTADRTIQTFMRVVANRTAQTMPRHYALLSAPDDPNKRRLLDQRLADANITPLWYPSGQHQNAGEILELLSSR